MFWDSPSPSPSSLSSTGWKIISASRQSNSLAGWISVAPAGTQTPFLDCKAFETRLKRTYPNQRNPCWSAQLCTCPFDRCCPFVNLFICRYRLTNGHIFVILFICQICSYKLINVQNFVHLFICSYKMDRLTEWTDFVKFFGFGGEIDVVPFSIL